MYIVVKVGFKAKRILLITASQIHPRLQLLLKCLHSNAPNTTRNKMGVGKKVSGVIAILFNEVCVLLGN